MADSQNRKQTPSEAPAESKQEAPPSYQDAGPATSSLPPAASSQQLEGPTPNDPFNFPPDTDLPSYSEAKPLNKPIAIPQATPGPSSPFLPAYAPTLLAHGVTPETWHSFVTTLSAFLTAKVSDKALAHASDMARHLGSPPVSFGKRVARNARAVGDHVRSRAQRGNYVGAAVGIVGGALSLTVGTVFGAAGTVMAMPGTAVGAVVRRPLSSRQRAEAYVAVANQDWLRGRGLEAVILDTPQLCRAVGLADPRQLLEEAGSGKGEGGGAAVQLRQLEQYLCEVQTADGEQSQLGANTLWLVVNQLPQ